MRFSAFPRILALAAASAGCGNPHSTGDMTAIDIALPPGGLLPLQLGGIADGNQADSAFVPIVDGQDATLVEGAQGGFHVWMKLRVGGGPRRVNLSKSAHRVSDGKLVLRVPMAPFDVGAAPSDGGADGMWEMPTATPMFMCPSPIGIRIIDEPIAYEITLSDDSGGTIGHAQVKMVPRCPAMPAATRSFCMMICVG